VPFAGGACVDPGWCDPKSRVRQEGTVQHAGPVRRPSRRVSQRSWLMSSSSAVQRAVPGERCQASGEANVSTISRSRTCKASSGTAHPVAPGLVTTFSTVSSGTAHPVAPGLVTTFSTVSRAHLRRAGPDGQDRTPGAGWGFPREAGRRSSRPQTVTVSGSRRCGAAAFAAPSGASPRRGEPPRAAVPRRTARATRRSTG